MSVTAGRVSAESQAPLRVSGQKLLSEDSTFLFNLVAASLSEWARARFFVVLRSFVRLSQRRSRSNHCQKNFGSVVRLWDLYMGLRCRATMADTARPYLVRGEGKFTRFRCAGVSRNIGFGCFRTDERCAVSVGCSDRIPVCRETVRTQSLRDSTHSDWGAGGPSGAAHPSDSFGVLCIKISADLVCQLEVVSEVPGRGSSDLRLTDDCHTLHRYSALRSGAKNAAEFLSCARTRRGRAPATGRPCPGSTHS